MDKTELLLLLLICMIVPPLTLVGLYHFLPPDPEHLAWCARINYSSDSCTLDHWQGRVKLSAVWLGTAAVIGLMFVVSQTDVNRRFAKLEMQHGIPPHPRTGAPKRRERKS